VQNVNIRCTQNMINTFPTIISFTALKPGDILLFRSLTHPDWFQHIILATQRLVCQQKQGHYDSTHVAICVGYDTENIPIIAHTTAEYKREPITALFKRCSGDRAFLVFRPSHQPWAMKLAEIAGDQPANHQLQWSYAKALSVFLHRSLRKPTLVSTPYTQSSLSTGTFCSNFVIECMQQATYALQANYPYLRYGLSIRAASTPRALEHHLSIEHSDYEQLCYPGLNAYQKLCDEIEKQLARIKHRSDLPSQLKHARILAAYQLSLKNREQKADTQAFFDLLNQILPELIPNTGGGWSTPHSYKTVRNLIGTMGLFTNNFPIFAVVPRPSTITQQPPYARLP